MQDILDAIMAAEQATDPARELAASVACRSRTATAAWSYAPTRWTCSRACPHPRQGPAQVAAPRRGADAGARPGRGADRRDGQRDQLQHRLDVDLRADVHVQLPAPLRAAVRADQAPRPAVPRGRLGRRRRGPAGRPGCDQVEAGRRGGRALPEVELEDADGHDDTMLDPQQRIWGFETNFGGLAELALVKSNQLMPKPAHLTWEEAACPGLVNSTAYRQLVSHNGAHMKQGDVVLIWGASGGLGSLRHPVRPQRRRHAGLRGVQPGEGRDCAGGWAPSWSSTGTPRGTGSGRTSTPRTSAEWRRFGARIRELTGGDDPDIVFEHPGRETFGATIYVARRGGTIVTCASTSGYLHQYDNRYLWMNLKRIVGSHFANYREAWEANRLVQRATDPPDAVPVVPARADRPGRLRGAPQPAPGQGRRAAAWPPRRAWAYATRAEGPARDRHQPVPRGVAPPDGEDRRHSPRAGVFTAP